ncbi:TlpA family protein disulfide reductase [Cohnella endophytica]|uniref:TlpA family protein disulfide reductase n=1 Tax=Cohnella endophytica TaxID=2419778 RepID=A0A494Y1U5_9BACL|nr:TlpA disulfide reductase family protein [Cohnella endophytica]RKP54312.1 TlpA family protein disulfide reductase [Cohnella endophytica]
MRRNIIILVLVAVVAASAWIWDTRDKASGGKTLGSNVSEGVAAGSADSEIPSEPAPKDNRYAPSFTLSSLDGTTTYEVGGKRDKALIVNFWAAWCYPCELEAPDLKDIYEKHKDKLDLYAVNATKFDKLREANDFVKEQQLPFPILTDAKGTVGDQYKVFSFPISFIIDRNGVIRHRIEGVIDRKKWEQYLEEVL